MQLSTTLTLSVVTSVPYPGHLDTVFKKVFRSVFTYLLYIGRYQGTFSFTDPRKFNYGSGRPKISRILLRIRSAGCHNVKMASSSNYFYKAHLKYTGAVEFIHKPTSKSLPNPMTLICVRLLDIKTIIKTNTRLFCSSFQLSVNRQGLKKKDLQHKKNLSWLWNHNCRLLYYYLKKLRPKIVSIIVGEVSGHLGGQVGALFPHALVGLVRHAEQDLALQLSFLLLRKLDTEKRECTVIILNNKNLFYLNANFAGS